MKPVTVVIGLILSSAIIAFVYGNGFRPDSRDAEVRDSLQTSSSGSSVEQSDEIGTDGDSQSSSGVESGASGEIDSDNVDDPHPLTADEEASRKEDREESIRLVQKNYSPIFEQLDLTAEEKDALSDLFVEVYTVGRTSSYTKDERIDEQERLNRIEEIIGFARMQELLSLERNIPQYREIERIDAMLQAKEAPLTDGQRDRMLEILIDVRGSEKAVADPKAKPSTMDALESQLAEMDEYDRLVLELAPSVLTSEQVEYLFERYQNQSYRRAAVMEMQKKARADGTSHEDAPPVYPKRD